LAPPQHEASFEVELTGEQQEEDLSDNTAISAYFSFTTSFNDISVITEIINKKIYLQHKILRSAFLAFCRSSEEPESLSQNGSIESREATIGSEG
jgi:hypothetical protein